MKYFDTWYQLHLKWWPPFLEPITAIQWIEKILNRRHFFVVVFAFYHHHFFKNFFFLFIFSLLLSRIPCLRAKPSKTVTDISFIRHDRFHYNIHSNRLIRRYGIYVLPSDDKPQWLIDINGRVKKEKCNHQEPSLDIGTIRNDQSALLHTDWVTQQS